MVLSQCLKRLEENFWKKIISAISQNDENYKKYFFQRFLIFWKNHYYYINKQYISRKPWISDLIWHPKSGRGITRKAPHPLAAKSIGARGGFLTSCLLWGLDSLMIVPNPLSGCQIKAEIKGFLLKCRLFQCKHWILPNFELKDFPELTFTPCTYSEKKSLKSQKVVLIEFTE
jgi:hypothetical protein